MNQLWAATATVGSIHKLVDGGPTSPGPQRATPLQPVKYMLTHLIADRIVVYWVAINKFVDTLQAVVSGFGSRPLRSLPANHTADHCRVAAVDSGVESGRIGGGHAIRYDLLPR